jgi:hypothetical protein
MLSRDAPDAYSVKEKLCCKYQALLLLFEKTDIN